MIPEEFCPVFFRCVFLFSRSDEIVHAEAETFDNAAGFCLMHFRKTMAEILKEFR